MNYKTWHKFSLIRPNQHYRVRLGLGKLGPRMIVPIDFGLGPSGPSAYLLVYLFVSGTILEVEFVKYP